MAAIKIEWLKSQACLGQWNEEVALLPVEMRHVNSSLQKRAAFWRERQSGWDGVDPVLAAGLQAYALHQADIFDRLHLHFLAMWQGIKSPAVGADNTEQDEVATLQEEDDRMDRMAYTD